MDFILIVFNFFKWIFYVNNYIVSFVSLFYKRTKIRLFYLYVINNTHISLLSSFHRLEDINGALSVSHHVSYCYFAARNFVLCDKQQKH